MMQEIDEILENLTLKNYSSMEEIAEDTNISLKKCELLLEFLSKYSFISVNDSSITINPQIKNLIIPSTIAKPTVKSMPKLYLKIQNK